jgi:hypothetical protein
MDNSLKLKFGKKYTIIQPFHDFDGILHPVGESWIYKGTKFLPYEDGLTLFVQVDNEIVTYRFQWRESEQASIIEHFSDFVKLED